MHPRADMVRFTLLVMLLLHFAGCGRTPERKSVVARVGAAELTEKDLRLGGDTLWSHARGSVQFVHDWVISELLYQEATRRGLADDDEIRARLEGARRHLAIAALLDREIYRITADSLSDLDSARSFFQSHQSDFILKEDVALVSFAGFAERDQANAFRASLLRGRGWESALSSLAMDSLGAPAVLRVVQRQYVTAGTLFPQELWKLARTLLRDDPSYAAKTDQAYYILQVHGYKRQGEVADFAFVRNEITGRFVVDRRRARYEQLVADLRTRRANEIRIMRIDTARENL